MKNIDLNQNYISAVYPTIFVSDLEKSVQWYCENLNFKVLAYNPHFTTMEIDLGRIRFISKDSLKIGSSNIGLHSQNIESFHQKLQTNDVDVDTLKDGVGDTKYFDFRDLDMNNFSVLSGFFGQNEIEYGFKPSIYRYNRYSLIEHDMVRAIGKKVRIHIESPVDLEESFKEFIDLLNDNLGSHYKREDIFCINPILDKYKDVKIHHAYICVHKQTDCILPTGCELLEIPSQKYAVFAYESNKNDFRADYTNKFKWLGKQFGFVKKGPGHPKAFILEFFHEKGINVYIPFETGVDKQHHYE